MILSHKTWLITGCITFSLQSMEQQTILTTKNVNSDNQNTYPILTLYNKTHNTLKTYNSTNQQSIISLTEILTEIKRLKNDNIIEKNVGLFAFQQEDSLSNKVFSYGKPPYNGPHYISVFFERLAQYNAHIEKNELTSPTSEQFDLHKNNRTIINSVNKAASFKLFIDLQKKNTEEELLTDIPCNIAVYDFQDLIDNITAMLHTTPEEIKSIASLLYGNKKQPNTTEKL